MSDYQQKALKLSIVPLCLLIGLILCVKINPPWFETLDLTVYTKINLPNFPQLTAIVRLFAKLATIGPTLCFAFLFAFYIWKKNYHLLAIWNICNIFAVSFFGYIIKKLIARIRPAVSQLEIRTSYSFPSGHSLLSFALFLTIILSLSIIWSRQDTRRVAWYLISYPLLIAATRLYLRVHYPSDILAGFSLSAVVVLLSYVICFSFISTDSILKTRQLEKKKTLFSKKQKVVLGLLVLLLAVILSGVAYELNVFYHAHG